MIDIKYLKYVIFQEENRNWICHILHISMVNILNLRSLCDNKVKDPVYSWNSDTVPKDRGQDSRY